MDKLLCNKDTVVAKIDRLNHFTWICKERAPLYLQNTEYLSGWLQGRCVDEHRRNSRLLKRALRLSEKDDEEIVLEVNAATITDTYWIKDADSTLTWDQVDFKKAEFSSLALIGSYNYYYSAEKATSKKTQELTNIGSFEKCWRVRDGVWWLYKEGNINELFSELFVYRLGKELGFDMAEYKLGTTYIKPGIRFVLSKDFTQGHRYNFEPIVSITGSNVQDYERTYKKIYDISPDAASDYVSLLFMDALIFNPDRHEYNFGLLSDPDTGAIIGLAPNFDNNLALISSGYPRSSKRGKDYLIADFNKLLDSGVEWKGYSTHQNLPKVNEQIIKNVIKELGIKVREKFIVDFIMSSYRLIGWNKEMTIERILQTINASEHPSLNTSKNIDNGALRLVTEDVFYILPTIKIIRRDSNPQVMIFSAAGATGKSALAKFLSKSFKSIYWDLSKTSVGENSFYGKLDKILGRRNVDAFQEKMVSGHTALIIDAFDEAEIRRGRSDIELFLNDIIEFVEPFQKPSMILFSRSENAKFLESYLSNHDVRIEHYEIGLIDEQSGKDFIKQLLKRKNREVTPAIEAAIDQEFSCISDYLCEDAKSFLGYAPVLEALTELIFQQRNTFTLIHDLQTGSQSDKLFEKIMRDLLIREQQKLTDQLKQEWSTAHPEFDNWEELYSVDEQINYILNYCCFGELVESVVFKKIPHEMQKDYEKAINSFLPSHPFIHQMEAGEFDFTGPAFRDFSIVYGLLSENNNLNYLAFEVLKKQTKTSPLLSRFFAAMSPSTSHNAIIDSDAFPYIYDSYKAAVKNNESTRLQILSSEETCYAILSRNSSNSIIESEELSLEVNCTSGNSHSTSSIRLPSIENAYISFSGKIIFQGITGEYNGSTEVSVSNSYIEADSIQFDTDKMLFSCNKDQPITIIAQNEILIHQNANFACPPEDELQLHAPNVKTDYRLRKYYFDISTREEESLLEFSHIIRSICIQFNYGKKRTISVMDKIFSRDNSSAKARIFSFLIANGCVREDGLDYALDLEKMSALNINWTPVAQNDSITYNDAYNLYQTWLEKSNT